MHSICHFYLEVSYNFIRFIRAREAENEGDAAKKVLEGVTPRPRRGLRVVQAGRDSGLRAAPPRATRNVKASQSPPP